MEHRRLSARQAAKAAGEKAYHGSACKRCGVTERRTSTAKCVPCSREYMRIWQQQNPGKVRTNALRWRVRNPEKYAEYSRSSAARWSKANPEKRKASVKRWRKANPQNHRDHVKRARLANPEKYKERDRRYRAANPEKIREKNVTWRKANQQRTNELNRRSYAANPATGLEKAARRRAAGRAATPKWLKTSGQHLDIKRLFALAKKSGRHVDHNVPLAGCRLCGAVGLHVLANLQLLEPFLNTSKANRCMACFLKETTDAEEEDRAQAHHDAESQ